MRSQYTASDVLCPLPLLISLQGFDGFLE